MIIWGQPPAGAPQQCSSFGNAIELDKVDKTFISGITLDANLVLGQTTLPCFATGKWRGYIARYDSLVLTWQKFIHGLFGTAIEHPLVSIPWLGLSKSALNHDYTIYTTYLGVYIRMASTDFLAFADVATGNFVNMQKIDTSAVNTFAGYIDSQFHKLYNSMFMLQTLVHNGVLTDYRIFVAFEDASTFAGNLFTLQSRSTTQMTKVNDIVSQYRYGVQCLNYLQHLYFGGARTYSNTFTGVTPLLGRANPSTLAIIEAFTLDGPDNTIDDARYVVEQIYLSHDATNHLLFAFARKRKNTAMDEVERIDRLMLITGRDHLAATPWQGSPGCWKYTTSLMRVPQNTQLYVDDFSGPIGNFLYLYVRLWNNNEPAFIAWNQETNFEYQIVQIERWDGVTCKAGPTRDDWQTGLRTRWDRYDNQCKINAGKVMDWEFGRIASKSRTADSSMVLCSADQVKPQGLGWTTINNNDYAAVAFELNNNNGNNVYNDNDQNLIDKTTWVTRIADFGAPTTIAISIIPSSLPWTLPPTTVAAAGGYPALVLDLTLELTTSSTITSVDYPSFAPWSVETPTYYQIQRFTFPTVQTMFSAGDIATVTVNYTSAGEITNIASLAHANTGSQVLRINLERFYDNDPPKEIYFYIGAQNLFGTTISGLYHVKYICPLAPIPTINHNNWATTSTLRMLMPLGGWTTATFNTWTVIELITKCSFLNYEATINATTAAYINYPYNSATCDYVWANCRVVNVLPSSEMKLSFDLSVRRVFPWSDLYGTTKYEIWATNCPTFSTTFGVNSVPLEVFERASAPSFATKNIGTSYFTPYVYQIPAAPPACPPVKYELVTTSDPTVLYSHPSIVHYFPTPVASSYFTVLLDTPAELSFNLKIWNFLDNFGTGTISFIVCGLEKIVAKFNTVQDFIFQQDKVNKYFVTSQAELVSFFTITYDKTNQCGLKFISAYDVSEFEVLWPLTKPEVSMPGAAGSEQLIVDKSYVQKSKIRIRATTKGLNYATVDYLVYVCRADSLQKTAAHKSFSILDTLNTANHDGYVSQYIYFLSDLSKMFEFKDCECCSAQILYKIVNTTTGLNYNDGDVFLDKDNNFIIDTSKPKHKYKISFRAYVNSIKEPRCNFFTPVDINFDIEICGSEKVLVQDSHKAIEITKIWNKERNFVMPDIRTYFTLEEEYKPICPITSYKLWNSTIFPPEVTGPTVWGTFIRLDPKTYEILVNHNNNPGVANNTVFTIYITAQTFGYQTGQKVFKFNLTYPPVNQAPKIKREGNKWDVYVSGEEQMKCAYKYPIIRYELPGIVDLESNNLTMKISIEPAPCDCLKIYKKEKKYPFEVPMVWVEIDQRLVTHIDQGVYKAEIYLYDEVYNTSFQNGYSSFEVEIIYNVGKRYYDPKECYRTSPNVTILRESLYAEEFNSFVKFMIWTKTQFQMIDGSVLIDPTVARERKSQMASDKQVNSTLAIFRHFNKIKDYIRPADPDPVHIFIDWISEDGFIYIKFNQELLVPFEQENFDESSFVINETKSLQDYMNTSFGYLRNANQNYSSGRRLSTGYSLDQINVTQHIFRFKYRLRNMVEPENIVYDITLEDWDSKGMLLQMNFVYPEFVSRHTNFDFAMLKVIDPSLFVSAETGVTLAEDYMILQDAFPKQYTHSNGTSVLQLDVSANVFISIVRVSAYFLMAYTIWFGYSFNDMWVLFYILQLICYIVHSSIPIPMPARVFLKHLTSFIEFDIFSPLFYLKLGVPRFSLYRWLFGIPFHFPYKSEYQKINYLDDFSVYIFWIILISILSFYVNCIFKKNSKTKGSLTTFFNAFSCLIDSKLYFNGYIRIYSIMYVKIALSIFAHMHVWIHAMFYQDTFVWIVTISLLIITGFLYGWIIRILFRYRLILGYMHNVKVFSNLYEGIHLYKNGSNVWYFPIFLARRLLYAAVPYLFFPFHPGFQIMGWLVLSTLSLMWYGHHRAHLEFRRRSIEIFNEFMFIVVIYNLMLFTDFNFYEKSYHDLSLLFIIIVCLIILVNVTQILLFEWQRWRNYRELLKRQQQWKEYLERRRELERILVQKLQHNIEVLKRNPDAWKPKLKRIEDKPDYYNQRINYKLKEHKWEQISHLTDPELTAQQMQKKINHSIHKELGNFGDIMQLSRIQLLGDYCQIRKKGQPKEVYYQIEKLPPLPDRLQEFPISFNQSSKNRWASLQLLQEEREEYQRQLAALRAREALEEKRLNRRTIRLPTISLPTIPSLRFEGINLQRRPQRDLSGLRIEDMSGLANLDTSKAIDHFKGVWQYEKTVMPAKKITIIEKVPVQARVDTMKDLINNSDSDDVQELDQAILESDSDNVMSFDKMSVAHSAATPYQSSAIKGRFDLFSIEEEPDLENRPSIADKNKNKKKVSKAASANIDGPRGLKYKEKQQSQLQLNDIAPLDLKSNGPMQSRLSGRQDIYDFSPKSGGSRKKKMKVKKKISKVHFEDDV